MKGLRVSSSIAALAISAALAAPLAAQPLPPTTGTITIDATDAEWGAVAQAPNTGGFFNAGAAGDHYVWTDAVGDALGNGSYTEASNENITFGQADIEEFRFAYDANNLYFYAKVASDQTFFGAFGCRLAIYIDRPDVSGGSDTSIIGNHAGDNQSPRVAFGSGFEFDYHLSNRGGYEGPHFYNVATDTSSYPGSVTEAENQVNRIVEMSVPWSEVGGYPQYPIDLKLVVGAGGPAEGNWRFVGASAGEFNHGGGCANGDLNSRLIDLIGAATGAEQNADLTVPDCGGSAPATISTSVITIPLDIESDLPFAPIPPAAGSIVPDGDPAKWGAHAFGDNEGGPVDAGTVGPHYVWKDAPDDDLGNGSYEYPTNAAFAPGMLDIEEFRVAYDLEGITFYVKTYGDQTYFGQAGARVGVWVDRSDIGTGADTTDVGNHKNFCQAPDVAFLPGLNWDFHVSNRGGFQSAYIYRVADNFSDFPGNVVEFESTANDVIELRVPWTDVGGFPTELMVMRMVVGVGSEGGEHWREILAGPAGEFSIGGGCDGNADATNNNGCLFDGDADLFDLIGASQAAQEADLTSSNCAAYTLPVITSSVVTVPIIPPASMVPLSASTYFDNSYIRFRFSSDATGETVQDPFNYTITNATPNDVTVEEVGFGPVSGTDFVWLRLSRDLTFDDIDAGVSIAFSDNIRSDNNIPIASGSTLLIPAVQYIIDVTIDASGDPQEFLAPPYMLGAWDSFQFRHLLRDGTSPYPNIPFPTTEAGDIPGDSIYRGRVFTTNDPDGDNYAIKSDFDFTGFNEPGTASTRALSVGYWMKYNYDPIYRSEGFINLTKPHQSRLVAEPVTVNFIVDVANDGLNFLPAQAAAAEAIVYVQGGVTFGPENSIPTDPSSTIPGDRDVPDGLALTYSGLMTVEGNSFMRFTGSANYPVGVPDISNYRLGYTFDGSIVREEPADTFGNRLNIIQNPPDNPGDFQTTSVHVHVARFVQDNGSGGTVGRTLRLVFLQASLDIVPPPANGLTAVPPPPGTLGDINDDGVINVADVTLLANLLVAGTPPAANIGDVNGDTFVNDLDVDALAGQIVND